MTDHWYDNIVETLVSAIDAIYAKKTDLPSDVSELSDSQNTIFTPKSHTHGNLQNNGQIIVNGNTQSLKNVVTTSNGYITAEEKPTIPSKTSDLTNDSNFIEEKDYILNQYIDEANISDINISLILSDNNIPEQAWLNENSFIDLCTTAGTTPNDIFSTALYGAGISDGIYAILDDVWSNSDAYYIIKTQANNNDVSVTYYGISNARILTEIAFSGSYNDLINQPTIPSASSTTPSADTQNGSYGSGTDYARANHTHPKSSLYAESSHTHTIGDIGATSEILEATLWDDDGSYVYMLDYYLAYDSSESKIYYNGTSPTNEIATKEDISEAIIYTMGYTDIMIGNAITYINQ